MPKETFFNLPEEKRLKVFNTALEEFALYDYNTASLSRIVEKAGIAKGSMYQYFENKKDLYLYLIKTAADTKLTSISKQTEEANDFFSRFKEINVLSAQWDLSHPYESRLIMNALQEKNEDLGDIATQILKMSDIYIQSFITEAQASGELRTDIPPDLLAFVISRISVSMPEYISGMQTYSFEKVVREGHGDFTFNPETVEQTFDWLITFLREGIKPIPRLENN